MAIRLNLEMETPKNEMIGCLEAGTGETRVEVILCERDGVDIIALQLSTWHETLGWQAQKTIPLAAEKIGQLQRLLSRTRNRIEDRRAPVGAPAQVIELVARGSSSEATTSVSQPARERDDQMVSAIN